MESHHHNSSTQKAVGWRFLLQPLLFTVSFPCCSPVNPYGSEHRMSCGFEWKELGDKFHCKYLAFLESPIIPPKLALLCQFKAQNVTLLWKLIKCFLLWQIWCQCTFALISISFGHWNACFPVSSLVSSAVKVENDGKNNRFLATYANYKIWNKVPFLTASYAWVRRNLVQLSDPKVWQVKKTL